MPKSRSSPPLRLRSFILYGVYSRSCCQYLCLSYIILFYLVYYRYKYNIMREIWRAAALRQQTAAISVKSWQRRCRPRIVSDMRRAMQPGSANCLLTHSHRPCFVSCGPRVNPLIRLGPVPPPPNVSSWSYGPLAACQSAWGARRLSPPDPVLETPLPPVKTHPPLSETTFRKFPERRGV